MGSNICLHDEKELFLVGILPAHSSSSHFFTDNLHEKRLSFLNKFSLMFYNYVLINHTSGFQMIFCKDHAKTDISFLPFPLGTSDAAKLKWLQGWIIYASNTVISSNTQTHLYSFCLEERTAEHRLLRNGKLVVILFKSMHYLGFQ